MNNLRKIICAVLVFALLCGSFIFATSAETNAADFTPGRTLNASVTDASRLSSVVSSAEGNLIGKVNGFNNNSKYKAKEYLVTETGNDDPYWFARVENNGATVTGSNGHNYCNMVLYENDVIGHKLVANDVFVYENDMYFESGMYNGLYFTPVMAKKTGSNSADFWIPQDKVATTKFPVGEWFHLTVIGDFSGDKIYYYVNGELISSFATGVRNNGSYPNWTSTNFNLAGFRWNINNAVLNHGDSFAVDNVYAKLITTSDLGEYTLGAATLDNFTQKQPYTLREVLPIATVDGVEYDTVTELNAVLADAANKEKAVSIELLRDFNANIVVSYDATVNTNGLYGVIKYPENATFTTEGNIVTCKVPYVPPYSENKVANGASAILSGGNVSNGAAYNWSQYFGGVKTEFFDLYDITPTAGGDTYLKISPVKDFEIFRNPEAVPGGSSAQGAQNPYINYTVNKDLDMKGYYAIDFDIATEGEHVNITLVPAIVNPSTGSLFPYGPTIEYKDFAAPANEWTHVTLIGDMVKNVTYLFVDGELVNANYGQAYRTDSGNYLGAGLKFSAMRLNYGSVGRAIKADESTLLNNLDVRVFGETEKAAIDAAVENKTLTAWANDYYDGNEALPGIITIDKVPYGNSIVASEALSVEGAEAYNVTFKADFEYPVTIGATAVVNTNGIGAYKVATGDPFEAEVEGENAIIYAPFVCNTDGDTVNVYKVTGENACELSTCVYWCYGDINGDIYSEYETVYYPEGTTIVYYGNNPIVNSTNYIENGNLSTFKGWYAEDAYDEYVTEFGTATAGGSYAYAADIETATTEITLPGAMYNLSLSTDYKINLFVPKTAYVGEGETVTAGGVEYVVLTKGVAANAIANAVEFLVTYTIEGVEYTEVIEVSVLEYAEAVMASDYSKMLKRTIMAALNYSETAIEELVNAEGDAAIKAILNAEANAEFKTVIPENFGESVDINKLNFLNGATFHIDATPDFIFFLKEGFVGTITFTYEGVEGTVTVTKEVNANENEVVVLENVKVYDVTATITITATVDGEEPIVGEYNLGTYVNEAPTAMGDKSTAKALYAYALAANTYKKACIAASQEA